MDSKLWQHVTHWLEIHPKIKIILENTLIFLGTVVSSLLAAYTFRSFIVPSSDVNAVPLITGGVSGVSQTLNRFFDLIHFLDVIDNRTLQAVFYFVLNIPIFILGMPRSGTSLVEQILSTHKDVFGGGELSFIEDYLLKNRGSIGLRMPEVLSKPNKENIQKTVKNTKKATGNNQNPINTNIFNAKSTTSQRNIKNIPFSNMSPNNKVVAGMFG